MDQSLQQFYTGEPTPDGQQSVNPVSNQPAFSQAQYASFISRFLAVLIDGFIIVIISVIISIPFVILNIALTIQFKEGAALISIMITSIQQFVNIVIGVAYSVYFIGKRGQTPGKMILKLKVVNIGTPNPPGFIRAFLREIIGKPISAFFFLLGFFWAIWDSKKQTWHDKIAGTVVIKT